MMENLKANLEKLAPKVKDLAAYNVNKDICDHRNYFTLKDTRFNQIQNLSSVERIST